MGIEAEMSRASRLPELFRHARAQIGTYASDLGISFERAPATRTNPVPATRRAAVGGAAMKIEWLNDEMTEARVTRGWWRQEVAHVCYVVPKYESNYWTFVPSGDKVDQSLTTFICRSQVAEKDRRLEQKRGANWQPVWAMPAAKVVRR